MGNCIRRQAVVSWADDEEWEWEEAGHGSAKLEGDKQQLLGEKGERLHPVATEVKIKITKKQLEELLRKVDAQGLPLQQVLAHLMSGSASDEDARSDRARNWQPALQSIPEAAESQL